MLLNGGVVVEEQVLPVRAEAVDGIAVGILQVIGVHVERRQAVLDAALVLQDGIVGSSRHVALLPGTLPALREVVVDLGLAHLTLLGRYEDDTVGGTGTVDSTRGSILQHLNRLNIAGVDALHTILVGRHTVDDVEGLGAVDGSDTTDADHRLGTRLARGRGDVHTCGHTLQGILGAQTRLAAEVVGTDLRDGGRHDALLLHTVADDDHVLQCLAVLLQCDIHVVTGVHLLRDVANITNNNRCTLADLNGEVTIEVGDGAILRVSFLDDRCSDDRFTKVVCHSSQDALGFRSH